ncbi:MAG: SIR2 family protein [Phycisphaerae bacterium]
MASRVFILGAGFSKQAGMPLATEITPFLLDKFRKYDIQEMLQWFEFLKQRIDWLNQKSSSLENTINIEQVFDLAKFDIESWRLKQHKCPLGRNAGDTPWGVAEGIDTWLSYMEEDLVEIIHEQQKVAENNIQTIINFAECLRKDDVVLTFNYDTLLEKAFFLIGKKWNHGFQKDQSSGVTICKMHGSIDWLIMRRNTSSHFNTIKLLFRKEDKNRNNQQDEKLTGELEYDYELARIYNDKLEAFVRGRHLQHQNSQFLFALAGLGSYKPLHRVPGMGVVWLNGMKALLDTEQIYVIGFSLSSFDNMARLQFAGAMCSREDKKKSRPSVTIIDPRADDLITEFKSCFGSGTLIEPRKKRAEEVVDWSVELK